MKDEPGPAEWESDSPARPVMAATTLVAGSWAVVPTVLAMLVAVGVQRQACSPSAIDCSWGFEYLAAGLVALIFWVVVAPVVVWLKQKQAQNRRAPVIAVATAGFMVIAFVITSQAGSWPAGILIGVVSPFAAIAMAQVVVGRH